ncbi:MAG: hypothetical protein JWP44_5184 [Mucilaginibacter sp.]|nr:hypothetical protein [Mucilaginibacter sp.]
MTDGRRAKALRLLEAQIEFVQAQLGPDRFALLVDAEVDHALSAAGELVLDGVVSREQIKATARKYATTMQIQGSIPELAGEIAARVYGHRAQDENRIGDVLGTEHVEALAGKLLELPLVRERLPESPLAVSVVSWWLYRIATDVMVHNREVAARVPGVSSLLAAGGRIVGTVAPGARVDLELRLRELAERSARLLLHRASAPSGTRDESSVYDAVIDLWRQHADEAIGSFRQYLSQDDLEDLLVIGYEFWLAFRGTAYLHALLDEGVDFFFDKYGHFTLRELLVEFGIEREDMVEEALRFGPPVIAVLVENGMLAAFLRRRLEPFFLSDEVLALLE